MEKRSVGTGSGNYDTVVAITGASRGIGLEIARTLDGVFDRLALIASSPASFDPIKDQFGDNVSFHWADFSCSSEVRRLADELGARYSHIDALVNNSGLYMEGPFESANLPDIERMIHVNTRAPIALTRMLLDQLKRGHNSIVINMSSIQATSSDANLAAYAASKSALSAFGEALRKELNPFGIRVTTLEPAGVNTWGEQNPVKLLSPTDVANVIKSIVTQSPHVQVHSIVLSSL